jgi:hypothetical protein
MTNREQINQHLVNAFREQEIDGLFGFFFVASVDRGDMSMSWAYSDRAKWTAQTGIELLERVIAVAEGALELARAEQLCATAA